MGCGGSKDASTGGKAFSDNYKEGRTLGEGAFAIVKEATKRGTNDSYAVKKVVRARLTEEDELALKDEIGILAELRHPNIIRLYETFVDAKFYYLVTEEMHGGELFDRIVAKSYYNEKEARDACKVLFEAMAYLHERNVAHRDLKPENLLLQSADDDTKIKLADFGFAKKIRGKEDSLTTQCGTPGYVSPEILEGVPYGTKTDMWSLGVIVFIILGGYPPFTDNDQRLLFAKIRSGKFTFHPEYWNAVSNEAKSLISSLMCVDTKKRMSAKQALQSPWITQDPNALAKVDLGKNLEEFKKFNAKRKFKAAVKGVVATNLMKAFVGGIKASSLERKLTADDIADLRETFNMFDKDGGGTISADELQTVMQKLGTNLSKADILAIIKQVDVNNDAEIDFDEFLSMMKKLPDTERELEEAFKVFDADGDGTTSKAELHRIMKKFGQVLTAAELDAVMLQVDANADGAITFAEFREAMMA